MKALNVVLMPQFVGVSNTVEEIIAAAEGVTLVEKAEKRFPPNKLGELRLNLPGSMVEAKSPEERPHIIFRLEGDDLINKLHAVRNREIPNTKSTIPFFNLAPHLCQFRDVCWWPQSPEEARDFEKYFGVPAA